MNTAPMIKRCFLADSRVQILIALCLTLLVPRRDALAANIGVDARTVISSTTTTQTNRLYLNAAKTLAPVTTRIWWVADTSGNGVPTAPQTVNVLGADDVLLYEDTVDGTLGGNQSARYQRGGILIDEIYKNARIYFYLWNAQIPINQQPTYAPSIGSTFGLAEAVVVAPPSGTLANYNWYIVTDVFADQYRVGQALPQPSQLGGVITSTANGTNSLQFTFTTQPSFNYRVQSTTNLLGNPTIQWTDEEPVVVGTGNPYNWLSAIKTNGVPVALQKYFRVVAQ